MSAIDVQPFIAGEQKALLCGGGEVPLRQRMEPFGKRAPRAEGPQDGLQVADGVQDREVVVGRGLPVDDARPVPGDEDVAGTEVAVHRSEEHTSELQSLMRISYAVFCLKKKKRQQNT